MTEEKKPVVWVVVVDDEIHILSKDPTDERSDHYEIALRPTGKRIDIEANILRNILIHAGIQVRQ